MNPEEFRAQGHRLVDWMADYMQTVEQLPVRAQVEPGDITAQLPAAAPEQGESFEQIWADFQQIIMPGMTHWQHPNFFAYFPANSSPPSVLAEMVMSTLAAQCMLWQTSPAATELETRVMEWLRDLLGIPQAWSGVIQDSASSATLCAVLTARERATGFTGNQQGPEVTQSLRFYASEQAHSSVVKAIRIAGIGEENLRLIAVDEQFAMDPQALWDAIAQDRAAGLRPAGVIACLGSTGVGGTDPIDSIGELCEAEGLYLHVDAAWAGAVLICPEQQHLIAGLERADSFVMNPHKWLLTNFDCSAHFVKDPMSLKRTLAILPAYLNSAETGSVIDYRDWSVPLGRRFRALKLWFVLRSYGAEALRNMIREHLEWTERLAALITESEDFELVDGPRFALLNFRYHPAGGLDSELDALNRALLERINADGRIYLTPNVVRGRATLRFSIGQAATTWSHVADGWEVVKELSRTLA